MNRQVELTWRRLQTIAHSLMVNTRVLEAYINFTLMYTTYHIFLVLPIKDMIIEVCDATMPFNSHQVRYLKYHIFVCYFVHVLYVKLLHMSTKSC